MIYYKTISQHENSDYGQMIIDGQVFEFNKINDIAYQYKVKVTNEKLGLLDSLKQAEGVVILTLKQYSSL